MGVPLQNIVRNCQELENSDKLKMLGEEFKTTIQNARVASNLMVFQLQDLYDWNLLKNNKFRTVSSKFSLVDSLAEVFEMMNMKALIKGLNLELICENKIPVQVIGDKSRLQ